MPELIYNELAQDLCLFTVNVLRSLRENDPKLIRSCKTLGKVDASETELKLVEANQELIAWMEEKIQAKLA